MTIEDLSPAIVDLGQAEFHQHLGVVLAELRSAQLQHRRRGAELRSRTRLSQPARGRVRQLYDRAARAHLRVSDSLTPGQSRRARYACLFEPLHPLFRGPLTQLLLRHCQTLVDVSVS